MSEQPLERLGKYQVLAELGRGGFAAVYRARDTVLQRDVALKILYPALVGDGDFVTRFQNDARAAAQLEHRHIVPIYDLGELEGRLFIAMQLLTGGTLAARIAGTGRMPFADAVRTLAEVADALDYAHARGFVHRDVKPTNILFNAHDESVLTDFGLVKAAESSIVARSTSGGVVGTPAYIAPEVWEGAPVGPPADVYALGCVAYEMLTGESMFRGDSSPAVMMAHFKPHKYPERWPEGVPAEVQSRLEKALAAEPNARYSSAGALAADFQVLLAGVARTPVAIPTPAAGPGGGDGGASRPVVTPATPATPVSGAGPQAAPSPTGVRCANCGAWNRSGVRFCEKCGSSLAGQPQSGVICPACGALHTTPVQFCRACGTPLGGRPQSGVICPSCGTVHTTPVKFCRACGALLGGPTRPPASAGRPAVLQAVSVLLAQQMGQRALLDVRWGDLKLGQLEVGLKRLLPEATFVDSTGRRFTVRTRPELREVDFCMGRKVLGSARATGVARWQIECEGRPYNLGQVDGTPAAGIWPGGSWLLADAAGQPSLAFERPGQASAPSPGARSEAGGRWRMEAYQAVPVQVIVLAYLCLVMG